MTRHRRERSLTREELLEAALGIVDAEGLAALTMRRLADAVGVEAMSLYHHVPSKEVLLDWTVERMRTEMRLPEPLPDDWASAVETIFVAYRSVLAAHPNMLPLAARRTDPSVPSGLQYLIEQGIAPEDAVELYQSLVAFTIGYSMLSSPAGATAWAGLPDELGTRLREWRDDTFRRTLRVVLDGYQPRLGETKR
jgi:TetR/AcrR family transcriptional regulator, tetracycline repressor protein